MKRWLAALAVLTVVTLFPMGLWVGSYIARVKKSSETTPPSNDEVVQKLERSASDKDRQIAQLERELKSASRDLAEQRKIIRKHALSKNVRSVDELLALFPAKYPQGNWSPAETLFEDCWFETVDGLRLHGWYLRHETPQAVILFAHGNAGNVTYRAALGAHLHKRFGVSVFLFDYRGYGRSEGRPSIDGLIHDARAARDYLARREEIPAKDVVLMGRSLGGAIVVELAAKDGARGLVLESTFSSLRDVASSHYPKLLVNVLVADRLDSACAIADYHGPLLISHGDADQTIPISLGRELFKAANEPKVFVRIPGGDHNDLQSDDYYDQLEGFLTSLPKQ